MGSNDFFVKINNINENMDALLEAGEKIDSVDDKIADITNKHLDVLDTKNLVDNIKDIVVEKEALVSSHYDTIDTVANNIDKIDITNSELPDIKTVANDIAKVNRNAENIGNIGIVGNDLANSWEYIEDNGSISGAISGGGGISLIKTVANNIDKVTAVVNNSENINIIADNKEKIISVGIALLLQQSEDNGGIGGEINFQVDKGFITDDVTNATGSSAIDICADNIEDIKNAYTYAIQVQNIANSISGLIDKINNIEENATADQTNEEIKAAYEATEYKLDFGTL